LAIDARPFFTETTNVATRGRASINMDARLVKFAPFANWAISRTSFTDIQGNRISLSLSLSLSLCVCVCVCVRVMQPSLKRQEMFKFFVSDARRRTINCCCLHSLHHNLSMNRFCIVTDLCFSWTRCAAICVHLSYDSRKWRDLVSKCDYYVVANHRICAREGIQNAK